MKLKTINTAEGKKHYFLCPGCQEVHCYTTESKTRPNWTFDGNMESPTFNPSLLVIGVKRCHLFLHNGKIAFCSDSEHDLKNSTVDMVDLPDWFQDVKDNPS